jgi:hypothetical protein
MGVIGPEAPPLEDGRTANRIDGRTGRLLEVAAWIAFAATFLAQAVSIMRVDGSTLLASTPDDVYYYLEIARHIARGDGFTFDGIHRTNGFHIAWQLLLVPLASFVADDVTLLKAVLVLALALILIASWLVVRLVARIVGVPLAVIAATAVLHVNVISGPWLNGMESPVVVLALALLATALLAFVSDPTHLRAALTGLACVGCVLARFDMAAIVWIVPIAMVLRFRSWSTVVWWAVGFVGLALPVGLWWLWLWGPHLLTTSATVKNYWVGDYMTQQYGGRLTAAALRAYLDLVRNYASSVVRGFTQTPWSIPRLVIPAVIAIIGAYGAWVGRRLLRLSPAAWVLAVVTVLATVKVFLDIFTAPMWALTWYAAPQRFYLPLAIVVLGFVGLRRMAGTKLILGAVMLVPYLLLVVPLGISSDPKSIVKAGDWQSADNEAADWLLENGPPGQYGAWDAGLLGYRLDGRHTVVNMDGLVNDYDYARVVTNKGSLKDQIRASGVDVMINFIDDETLRSEFACATVLWRTPQTIFPDDPLMPPNEGRVYVLDVTGCR